MTYQGNKFTYLFGHLVLNADTLSLEEVLEGFLLLAVLLEDPWKQENAGVHLPVDVTKLVLTQATLQAHSDVKGSAGRNSASNT